MNTSPRFIIKIEKFKSGNLKFEGYYSITKMFLCYSELKTMKLKQIGRQNIFSILTPRVVHFY